LSRLAQDLLEQALVDVVRARARDEDSAPLDEAEGLSVRLEVALSSARELSSRGRELRRVEHDEVEAPPALPEAAELRIQIGTANLGSCFDAVEG
jgi:hypothetical protein